MNKNKNNLTLKDLVTIGIFTALILVFTTIGGIIFGINPVLTFYVPMGAAALCGPIYLLFIVKVHKSWSITILGILVGIMCFVTGMHWAQAIGYASMGLVADIIARTKNYKSKKMNMVSYMIFSLGCTFSYMVFFIDQEGWIKLMLKNGTDTSYIDAMQATATSWMPAGIIVGTLIVAAISSLVGNKLLKKHFERAGIID